MPERRASDGPPRGKVLAHPVTALVLRAHGSLAILQRLVSQAVEAVIIGGGASKAGGATHFPKMRSAFSVARVPLQSGSPFLPIRGGCKTCIRLKGGDRSAIQAEHRIGNVGDRRLMGDRDHGHRPT